MSESFEERARARRATWGMEARTADGTLVALSGPSTSLLRLARSNADALENLAAQRRLVLAFFPDVDENSRMDRTHVRLVFKKTSGTEPT